MIAASRKVKMGFAHWFGLRSFVSSCLLTAVSAPVTVSNEEAPVMQQHIWTGCSPLFASCGHHHNRPGTHRCTIGW